MFERFSSGYYLGRLYVTPGERETAAMSREQHERVNQQLYADDDGSPSSDRPGVRRPRSGGTERDRPLVMKLDERHFPVTGDDGVPRNTLAVPRDLLEDTRIRNPPALKSVLLAKADRAKQLLELIGDEPSGDGTDWSGGPAF